MGPCLFSIHVNDLPAFISKGYLFMFADDTAMYCIRKNIEDVIDQLNERTFTGPLRPIWFGTSIIKYVTQSTQVLV